MNDEKYESKNLKVSELPDGWPKERLVEMVKDPEQADVFAVAKLGGIGDWACYVGFPDFTQLKPSEQDNNKLYYCTNVRHPNGVMRWGDKVGQAVAEQLFPDWAQFSYRR